MATTPRTSTRLREKVKKEEPGPFYYGEIKHEIREEEIDEFFAYYSGSELSGTSTDIKLPLKKRGVKFKPKRDEKTNKRRAMNKEAALRYREKRRGSVVKLRMYYLHLEKQNRELKAKERKLLKEVAVYEKLLQLKQFE